MGRIRYIKPGFFTNEELAALPPLTRLLFAGLWTLADCKGRLEDRPKRIKAELFAYDDFDVDEALAALHKGGFITRYTVKKLSCIQIVSFHLHQRPHPREQSAKLPEPPKTGLKNKSRDITRPSREKAGMQVRSGTAEPDMFTAQPGIDLDLNGDLNGDLKSVSAEPLRVSPPALTFPTRGHTRIYVLTEQQVSDWEVLYPGLEVLAECRKALAWCIANKPKQKTAGGMPKFLVTWLNRATNQPASVPSRGPRRLGPNDSGYYDRIGEAS